MEELICFYCDKCMVEFGIRVEPGKSKVAVEKDFPDSAKWQDNLGKNGCLCPECGDDCEVR